jgi:predicted secreted protein
MEPVSGVVVYVLLWWWVFFMTLPVGVKVPEASEVEVGHATSAPRNPNLLKKVIAATLIAAVLWGGAYMLIDADVISFRDMAREMK